MKEVSAIETPRVSVIMGIYNCEDTLSEAIESILTQTYSNLELIMCDDGSADDTHDIALRYAEKNDRITLLRNHENKGLAYTLNRCLVYANGSLIARQDGDDISVPERIEKQVACFSQQKYISIVSTGTTLFDEHGVWAEMMSPPFPTKYDFIKESPFCHGSSMMKKSSLVAIGGYDPTKASWRAEDYDLWFRLYAAGYKGVNIQESLYWVRDDRDATNRRKFRYRLIESHIKYRGFRLLEIPYRKYFFIVRPIIVGFVPKGFYNSYRRRKYS